MKRLTNAVGLLIAALGVGFVIRELARQRDEVLAAVSGATPARLIVALLLGLGAMCTIGLAWRRCLRVLGHRRGVADTLRRYFVGQLGKYVPGGIWPVVGRAEMARRGGVPGAAAYGSTLLSLGLTYLAAVLMVLLALLSGPGGGRQVAWQPIVLLLPAGLTILHPRILGLILGGLRKLSRRELDVPVPRWGVSVTLLLVHLPAWLAISIATWLVAYAMSGTPPDLRNLIFATTLSWLVGFLAVPVPGGIGVREAVFVAAATSLPSTGLAAAVALVSRVLFILVDLTGAAVTSLLPRDNAAGTPTDRFRDPEYPDRGD